MESLSDLITHTNLGKSGNIARGAADIAWSLLTLTINSILYENVSTYNQESIPKKINILKIYFILKYIFNAKKNNLSKKE